jgi:hypothetical protein
MTHTRLGFYLGDNSMGEYNEWMARVALCEQRAKGARTESEKQHWLVMADSWRETVKLREMLTRQAEYGQSAELELLPWNWTERTARVAA